MVSHPGALARPLRSPITRPLTRAEIIEQAASDGQLCVVISIGFTELVEMGGTNMMDEYADARIVGINIPASMTGLSYYVIGFDPQNHIWIEVKGDVSAVLEMIQCDCGGVIEEPGLSRCRTCYDALSLPLSDLM